MNEPYVILNNYNYALNEEFDYLDGFVPEWREEEEPKDESNNYKTQTELISADAKRS